MKLYYKKMASPVGKLQLVASDSALVAILWENDNVDRVRLPVMTLNLDHSILNRVEKQLTEYFRGDRSKFDIPLDPLGTDFQKQVWHELRRIPFGQTKSYGEIARSIGSPNAQRAVGAANGRNPISIVVPCHRVIGSNGKLTGFAGGLKAKATLLQLENQPAKEMV